MRCSTTGPGDCSPYSPNSRLFLNALYIDVGNDARISAWRDSPAVRDAIARLRGGDIVDYAAVAGLKWRGAARGVRGLQGRSARAAAQDFDGISRRARAAAVAVRLLRGAAAQIQQAVVGMAGGMAAARRCQMRVLRRGRRGRDRIRRIRAMDRRPAARAPARRARAPARHEGRALSRRRRRRAVRRLRCLERAGGDFAPSRVGAPPDPLNTAGQNWGLAGFNAAGLEMQSFEPYPRDAAGLDAPCRRDPARSCAGPEAALSGAARVRRARRRLCADAVRGAAGGDRAGKRGASLRGDRRGPRHRAGRISRDRWPIGASGRTR